MAVSSYPSTIFATNTSLDCTSREVISINGINTETMKMNNINFMFGKVNTIKYMQEMCNFPSLSYLDYLVEKEKSI